MARSRQPHERERDREIIIGYYLKGYSTRKIAEFLSLDVGNEYTISHKTVAADIAKTLEEWKTRQLDEINLYKVSEIEKVNKLENTCWTAWDKSEILNGGNPAYLSMIDKCIERRCKILGVEAPQKINHDGLNFPTVPPQVNIYHSGPPLARNEDEIDQ